MPPAVMSMLSGQGLAEDAGTFGGGQRQGTDVFRVGQASGTGVGAGQPAVGRLQDYGAAAAQGRHIVACRRMAPHLGVHRRGQHDRAVVDDQGTGGEQVVRPALRQACHEVGGGRGDDHEVGLLAQSHMADLVHGVEDGGGHRVAGERLECRRADEPQGGVGGYHVDLMAGFSEVAHQRAGLVGGDAPAHPDEDLESVVVHGTPAYATEPRRNRTGPHWTALDRTGPHTTAQDRIRPHDRAPVPDDGDGRSWRHR